VISNKYKFLFSLALVLAVLSLVISGCSGDANQSVTFSQLISQADKYNGKTVTFEAFYFAGFEISALSTSVGPSTFGNGRIAPVGTLIWVKSGIPEDLFNRLYTQTQTPSGYPEHIGKLKISGKFETGGKYGHLDAYQYQISITSAEQLEWSPPPPAVTPTPLTGDLQFKVTDLSGNPLPGAKVVSEEQPEGQLKVTGMTDYSGTVTFKDNKPGEYRFYVSGAGFLQQNNVAAAVANGQTSSVAVKMTPAG
jgi:hypothetical protein